jgi:hypothetical protein
LQLTFTGPGVAGKNVEDELRPVDHAALDDFFDIALLRRRQIMIKEQDISIDRSGRSGDLLELSGAYQCRWIWPVAALQDLSYNISPGALGERA